MRASPCSGTSHPLMCALRVKEPTNRSERIVAPATAAAVTNMRVEILGLSRTVPSHCPCRSVATSGRNSGWRSSERDASAWSVDPIFAAGSDMTLRRVAEIDGLERARFEAQFDHALFDLQVVHRAVHLSDG